MKKLAILMLAIALLACVTVYATVAFFTDTAEVTNTFTVGDVKIDLDETDTNPNDKGGNEYHLVPGQTYLKDPTITVRDNSEACYVRMMVTLNKISTLEKLFGVNFLPNTLATDAEGKETWNSEKWPCVGIYDNGDDTRTYEFRYMSVVPASDADQKLSPLFTHFSVPGSLTRYDLEKLLDDPSTTAVDEGFQIKIVGHAIQQSGFGDADAAWKAFDQQNGFKTGTPMLPQQPANPNP